MEDSGVELPRMPRTVAVISILIVVGMIVAAVLSGWVATRLGFGSTGQALAGGARFVLVAGPGFLSMPSIKRPWESWMDKATAERF